MGNKNDDRSQLELIWKLGLVVNTMEQLINYTIDGGKGEGVLKRWIARHGEMALALASGLFVLLGWLVEKNNSFWAVGLYLTAYILGGIHQIKEGLEELIDEKEMNVHLLMILAAVGAALIGYWLEGALLIFIFSLSGALETYTVAKSERDLSRLIQLKPVTAVKLESGFEREVRVEEVQIGDHIIVRPGERIPVDGKVMEGHSAVNQAAITGESVPVEKAVGDEVFAGTMNGTGSLIVEVTKPNEESVFARIVKLVEEAKKQVPEAQRKIERLEKGYSKVVLVITIFLLWLPHYLIGWSWEETFYRAMVFLVVASPCALVASIMPAVLSAMSRGARKGVLFKNGAQLEHLAEIKAVAFDKTGTLTKGKLEVTDFVNFSNYSDNQLLRIAASIERLSEHPIAKAIVAFAEENGLKLDRPTQLQSMTGWGVEAIYEGEKWRMGKPSFFSPISRQVQEVVDEKSQEGKTVILVERNGEILGLFALSDQIREEAKETVEGLKQLGLQVVMLTGDQPMVAEKVAGELGVDRVYSGLLPDEKVEMVKTLQAKHGAVAMVGDGVNDAPALAVAQVGIAMGHAGSAVALETADVVLMKDDLPKLLFSFQLAQKMRRVIWQNISFAFSVILLLLLTNFLQLINLPFGVIGHEGSTILVILNGLRLLAMRI